MRKTAIRRAIAGLLGLVALSVVFEAAPAAFAADVYVNNRVGRDYYDGTSPTAQGTGIGPVRTVQAAIRRVHPGDRIVILPSGYPYNEPIVVPYQSGLGSKNYPLIIEGNGTELVGYRQIDPYDWDYTKGGVYRLRRPFQPTGVLFSETGPIPRKGTELWGDMPPLERGEYAFWAGHYYFRPARPFDLASHRLAEANRASGIVIDRTSHVIIRNFRVRGFRDDAIQVKGPADGVRIESCLMADNGRAGFSATTNANVQITGSFVTGNVKIGVLAENYTRLTLAATAVDGNGSPRRVDGTTIVDDRGGTPEPLKNGPFVLPTNWGPATPRPLEEVKPVEPPENPQK